MVHGAGNWCKHVEGSYYSRIVEDSGNLRNSIQCSASESNKLVEHSLLSCLFQMCKLNCDDDNCASDADVGEETTTTTYRRLRRRLTRAEAAWNMAEEAFSQAERSAWRAAHPLRTCRCAAGRHSRSTPICMVTANTRSSNPGAWWLPDCDRRCGVRNPRAKEQEQQAGPEGWKLLLGDEHRSDPKVPMTCLCSQFISIQFFGSFQNFNTLSSL